MSAMGRKQTLGLPFSSGEDPRFGFRSPTQTQVLQGMWPSQSDTVFAPVSVTPTIIITHVRLLNCRCRARLLHRCIL